MFIALLIALSFTGNQELQKDDSGKGDAPACPEFDFQNHFWLNLHHFLYSEGSVQSRGGTVGPDMTTLLKEDALSTWKESIGYYRLHVVKRDLVFDQGLRHFSWNLSSVVGEEDLPAAEALGLDEGHRVALLGAAPLYREHAWPLHRKRNEEWIAQMKGLVAIHGDNFGEFLSETFARPWPNDSVRVDVLCYASWAGAYTSPDPSHLRISALDSRVRSDAERLEVLFHESCHLIVSPFRGPTIDALNQHARKFEDLDSSTKTQGPGVVPRDLWHALIFFSAGEAVERFFDDVSNFVPYAERNGLYARGDWGLLRSAMPGPWRAYLDGKISLETACSQILDHIWELQEKSEDVFPESSTQHVP